MTRSLSQPSLDRLSKCHPDLQRLVHEVARHKEIVVVCGYRSKEEQDLAVLKKTTRLPWPKSKHNHLPAWAVDLAPFSAEPPHIRWGDIAAFKALGAFTLGVAKEMGISIVWGGDWKTFKDYPHYELMGRPLPAKKPQG